MNGDLIRLERAEIGYEAPLLPPIDLAIHRGQKLAVLGPNGGGKSTLLKTIIGLVPPLTGRRLFPNGGAPRIGYVPQSHRADPVYPLTACDVVLQGRFARIGRFRFPDKADREMALRQLQKVGLLQCASLPFRELSGGQRQRVLLARALCGEPDLLVLDEFTSDLDPAASAGLLAEVSRLADELSVSVLFVTHEIGAAVSHASEVAMVDSRSGVFESGAASAMLTSERLSRLYGQHVDVQRQEGKAVVFIETPTGAGS